MTAVGLTPGPGIVGTGSRTYSARSGYLAHDMQTTAGLGVDTSEAQGALVSPSITEPDMLAGLWDFARLTVFRVNYADLTMGAMIERSGTIGEVTTESRISGGIFRAEWRGLFQAYQQVVGRLYSPSCDAIFGDARCGKDLTALTFSGAIEGLGDLLTFYDSSLTQPGPAGSIAITNISNANPGIVTMASAGSFINGDPVTLSTIVGPTLLNGSTRIAGLSGNAWSLGLDTTDTAVYPPYVSGGLVTPLGGTAGFFEAGKVTWTGGLNLGRSEIVKFYVPGQVTLQLPMPYARAIGDTYDIIKGCIKSLSACRDTHNNLVNFRGFPFFPGNDAIMLVGRRA